MPVQCERCQKQCVFGIPGTKEALRCGDHRELGDIDVKHKTCQVDSCRKLPSFFILSSINKLEKVCFEHSSKKKAMSKREFSLRKKNQQCILGFFSSISCNLIAIYGFREKNYPISCKSHLSMDPELTYLENFDEKCFVCESKNSCLLKHEEKYYCEQHFPKRSELLTSRRKCSICDPSLYGKTKYLCKDCKFSLMNKDRKEIRFKSYLVGDRRLKPYLKRYPLNHDMIVSTECDSRRRPDFRISIPNKAHILIEVDENNHRSYDHSCECKRISEIVASLSALEIGIPIIFLRFNPDSFVLTSNKGVRKTVSAAKNEEDFNARCEYFLGILLSILECYEKRVPVNEEKNVEIILIKIFDDKTGIEDICWKDLKVFAKESEKMPEKISYLVYEKYSSLFASMYSEEDITSFMGPKGM